MMENEWIDWLRERLPEPASIDVGLGDDAAVLAAAEADERTIVTTDLLMDQVHFKLGEHDPREIGYKALAVNLSDVAAMAAEPTAAFVSIAVPRSCGEASESGSGCEPGGAKPGGLELAKELYEGFLPLAEKYNVAIAGGDTNLWDGPLVISMTLLGRVGDRGPLLRSGAKVGDQLLVTGSLGGSILGRHLRPEPRVHEALLLHGKYELHAGLDCSDGLLLDTFRMCQESGAGAVIDLEAVPVSADAETLTRECNDGITALEHALGDGEDFELILAVPLGEAERMLREQPLDRPLIRVGQIVAERGLWCEVDGQREALSPRGYEHQ